MIRKKRFVLGKPKSDDITHLFVGGISGIVFSVGFTYWFMNYLGV